MHVAERPGEEPVAVFVHGYCQSSEYWLPTLDRLASAGRMAIAPDLPGFGASAPVPGPYTMEGYADALAKMLDERGFGRVILAGGSMGGVVAQHFALRHPQRVLRLLLVATGAFTADPTAALAKAEAVEAAPWNEQAVFPIVEGFFFSKPSAERLTHFRSLALMASKEAAVQAARSNASSRTLESLHQISVPTLIIQGRHDRARTPEHGALMRDRLPHARLEVLEGSGHTPQLEEPDAFHRVALPFLMESGLVEESP